MSLYSDLITGTSGLIAYYRMGEASGTTLMDQTGSYAGTYGGGYSLAQQGAFAAEADTAAAFNGSTGFATAAVPLAGPYTIEAWVKPSGTSGVRNIMSSAATTNGGYAIQLRQDANSWNLYHTFQYDRNVRHTGGVVAGAWTYIAATWDGNAIRLYTKGALRATAGGVTGLGRGGNSTWIACDGNDNNAFGGNKGQYWLGSLDEMAFYSRALNASEISARQAVYAPAFFEKWDTF